MTESTVHQLNLLDMICPYCNHQLNAEPSNGAICRRCCNEVFIRITPSGFRPLMTQLHKHLLAQQWPPYLTREQCLRIADVYQLGTDALEREITPAILIDAIQFAFNDSGARFLGTGGYVSLYVHPCPKS